MYGMQTDVRHQEPLLLPNRHCSPLLLRQQMLPVIDSVMEVLPLPQAEELLLIPMPGLQVDAQHLPARVYARKITPSLLPIRKDAPPRQLLLSQSHYLYTKSFNDSGNLQRNLGRNC